MGKIKIMLIAITIMATVGGALAFKAKMRYSSMYCIRAATLGAGTCTDCLIGRTTAIGPTYYYYTTTFNCAGCSMVTCTRTNRLTLQ